MSRQLRDQMEPEKIRHRRFGGWLLLPLLLMTMVVFVFARQWRDLLDVEKVSVEGAHILTANDVVAMAGIQPPAFMFQADLFEAQQKLLAQPYIKEAGISRQLPHTLRIVIKEREPVASLGGSDLRFVDTECVLLPHLGSGVQFDVPVISGINDLDSAVYGKRIENADLTQAIGVLKAGQAVGFYRSISEVHAAPGADLLLYPVDGGVPVILGRGTMGKKMLLLQTFWTNFMRPDTLAQLQYIDARFDGQIVTKRAPTGTKSGK